MKKNILFGILMLFAQILSAQNDTIAVFSKKNALSLGLNMSGLIHYDRVVWQKGKHKLGFGVGGWAWERDNFSLLKTEKLSHFVGSASFNYLYGRNKRMLELNIIYAANYDQIRLGGGAYGKITENGYAGYASGDAFYNSSEIRKMWDNKTEFLIDSTYISGQKAHHLALRVGYRRQKPKGGFFFKTGITLMGLNLGKTGNLRYFWDIKGLENSRFGFFLMPDVSFGWSF